MASLASQDLESCHPQIVLKHKHLENSPNENLDLENDNKNCDLGGWSFIKAVTNTPQICNKQTHVQNVYVHPLDKSAFPILSSKSLEMCTENLGSETGSDISESSEEFSYLTFETKKIKGTQCVKKPTFSASFPPPLTSISSIDGVRVSPHREGGRLVIRAVNISSTYTYFQADRSNGRLRLSFSKYRNLKEKHGGEEIEEVKEWKENEHVNKLEEEEEEGGEELEGEDEGNRENVGYENGNSENVEYENENSEKDGYENGKNEKMGYENGKSEKVGYENGNNEELARPSRCKETNGNGNAKGMSIWGPYCVAIS